MTTAIRKHFRDFVAIAVLIVVALVASYIIVQHQRLRIPIFESKPFELKAEFQTAQAVVPGQGQTINVAGVGSPGCGSATSRTSSSSTGSAWSRSRSTASSCRSTATRRS